MSLGDVTISAILNNKVPPPDTSVMDINFSELLDSARVLWAKSIDPAGHSVVAHILDVAAVAEAILAREPASTRKWAACHFGLPESCIFRWLAALVGLHDFGKTIPGFQSKWAIGREQDERAGLPFPGIALGVARHDLASAALLQNLLVGRFQSTRSISHLLMAVAAHHGYAPSQSEINQAKPRYEGKKWQEARVALLDAYWQTLAPTGAPADSQLALSAVAWLAGLTSVADWIGSNQDWFPRGERHVSLAGHFANAHALADAALDDIGWPKFRPLLDHVAGVDALIGRMFGQPENFAARPLQAIADRMLSHANGPTLLVVEAPMGEGKTELAFLAHLRLQRANGHRGLYVALPTQATGNAMFERTLTFLQSFLPDVVLDIQLAHGGAAMNERVHRLRDINSSASESVGSSVWFSQRRRALLSPYGVGTIDQALFATLNVKHHFVRLWGLANRVIVLDEVHAYDTYTSGLIEALLRWLKAMNCSVVLMSATLPTKRRTAFFEAWGAPARTVPNLPYPRILMTRGEGVVGEHVGCRTLAPIQVTAIAEEVEALADCALSKLAGGGCGAVIVNTVQRAQDLYLLLKSRLGGTAELLLFHARYPADERSERERAILDRFGRNSERPTHALLVATQVVEQSLDIDFDFLISDLAPVDLLLQRAGRLHRHERQRPAAHRLPVFTVGGLSSARPPELKATKWQFVYDPYILYRTWALVSQEPVWYLPADIDRMVQKVYGPTALPDDLPTDVEKMIDAAFGRSCAEQQQQSISARNAAIDADDEPQNAYLQKPRGDEEGDGLGIRAVTRLGDDGVTAVPVWVSEDGWRLRPGEAPFDPAIVLDDSLAQRIYRRQIRLARKDVVVALAAAPLPAGFSEHPLLRHLKPLLLTENGIEIGKLRLRLDDELGITYESNSSSSMEGA